MEWIWNYVFALLTSHSITQMDSCRHGCWAKLVTLSPNNIAITKSHTNYGHIGIFIGAWAWQPKQCPLGESGVGSLCLTMVLSSSLWHHIRSRMGYGPPGSPPIAPGPGLCLLSPHNGQTRINVRSFSQQSAPSDMNHIPVAWPPSSLYRVWKIKWEAVCHPVHVAWGINRFVIEHILVYLCGEFELSATNLCDHFLWNAEADYWR